MLEWPPPLRKTVVISVVLDAFAFLFLVFVMAFDNAKIHWTDFLLLNPFIGFPMILTFTGRGASSIYFLK